MSSSPPDSRPSLRGLPGGPVFARERSESGERQSVRALEVIPDLELPSPRNYMADREINSVAPGITQAKPLTHDELAKRRARASLWSAVEEAESQRRLASLGRIDESAVRHWLEIPNRHVPLHLVFRVPDHLAEKMLEHVVVHWGRRSLVRFRDFLEGLIARATDDQPVRRAM